MDEDKFWQIIESFDWSMEGYDHAVMKPAIDTLSQMTVADLRRFGEILAQKLYALDTQAHAAPTGFGTEHFSVDTFLYQRCVVVVNGRALYEQVLNHQRQIPKDLEFEMLLNLTDSAAEEMGLDDYLDDTTVSYETFSNKAGWKDADFPDALPPGHKPPHQR